jgi:D-3-phosphoglycerate dehydrogenase
MKNPKILCPSPRLFSSLGLAYAQEKLNVEIIDMGQAEFESVLKDYEGALVRFDRNFTSALIQQSKLKYIICPTTGLTHIDLKAAAENNVEIISLKGEYNFLDSIVATAEHSLALLLALKRNIIASSEDTNLFNWEPSLHRGSEVSGSKVGIIGMGRLGSIFANYCSALGAKIYYYDPYVSSTNGSYIQIDDVNELAEICSVISIHVNLESNNYKFLGEQFFSKIGELDVFINTSRGELIDEIALIIAFDQGRIKKIGLDVLDCELEGELSSNSVLMRATKTNNIIVTPHLGGATFESISKTDVFIVNKFLKFLRSQE